MRRGFSLVELSIVLVILGLLVGGILAGRSLIRASELRAVVTDMDKYQSATLAFRDKYFGLPGDIRNATAFWGAAADCSAQTETGQATCNGGGNGSIVWGSPTNNRSETFLFWQHLSNAGLIEGAYTGVRGPGTYGASHAPGVNSPLIMDKGCVTAAQTSLFTSNVMHPAPTARNHFVIGGATGANPDYCYGHLLKPEEQWNIDSKTDDGIAHSGKVFGWMRTGCYTNLTPGSGDYNLSSNAAYCSLLFAMKAL